MNPAVSRWGHRGEESWAHINIRVSAALACVDHSSLRGSPGRWVEDRDLLAAERVGVGICPVVHHSNGESDNGIGVVADDSTGTEACTIVCDIPGIWEVAPGVEWYSGSKCREKDDGTGEELHG